VPNSGASLVNILKMCNSFSSVGGDIRISMPVESSETAIDCLKGYGISIPSPYFFPKKLGRFLFILWSVLKSKNENRKIFTRSVEVGFLACVLGVDFVLELHSPHTERPFYIREMLKVILRSNRMILLVAISAALKDMLVRHYSMDERSILVLHDGSDIEIDGVKVNDQVKDIGYIGHLYKGRGIDLILEIARNFPDLNFHIVGGDQKDVEYWKNVSTENMKFYGHITHQEASEIRINMDILLAPYQLDTRTRGGVNSTSWMSPLKVFEYMASGVPFVCSEISVLKEVLQNERNCLLVTANELPEWIRAIDRLKGDREIRQSLAVSAFSDIEQHYSWNNRAKKILNQMSRKE
jgi:glycosyltransferase involved in cell wall biosynthesis